MVTIDLWADVTCPFCGITHLRLERVVREHPRAREISVVQHAFVGSADLPESGITQSDLAGRAGVSAGALAAALGPVEEAARREGFIDFRAIDRTVGPTGLTHELLAFAAASGRRAEIWHAMITAHFAENRQLWTTPQLVAFAAEVGLDRDAAEHVLSGRRYRDAVEADQQRALALGARGIPFLVIDGRSALSGMQSIESLRAAIDRAFSDLDAASPALDVLTGNAGAACAEPQQEKETR